MNNIDLRKDTGSLAFPASGVDSPLYPRNFLASRTPDKIFLSESVSEVIPELSQTPVENCYWVLGRYVGQNFVALDTRFTSYGSPTAVPVSSSDFLYFNREIQKLSYELPDFAIVPLHNHPDVLQYVAETGPCMPLKFIAEINQYLEDIIDRLLTLDNSQTDLSRLNLSSFKKLLFVNAYQLKNVSLADREIIAQAKSIAEQACLELSDQDCSLGAAFPFLCPFSETVAGRYKGIIARVVDCDLEDKEFPIFSQSYRLIPIKSELPDEVGEIIRDGEFLINRINREVYSQSELCKDVGYSVTSASSALKKQSRSSCNRLVY